MKTLLLSILSVLLLVAPVVEAQNPACPAQVLLALARAGSTCYGLERNQACIGNGTTVGEFFSNLDPVAFTQPGDRVDAARLQNIAVSPIPEGVSVASLYTQASLTDAEERSVALLLLGEVSLLNEVEPTLEMTAYATGALNIRKTPEANGDIITRMAINQAVTANGRTQEGDWLRVHVPNSNDLGWVSTEVVNPTGNILNLSVVGLDTPVFRPFQVFKMRTGETAFCEGALLGGLLIQTPNATQAELTINGVKMQLNGTFFLQSGGSMTVNVLSGQAVLTVGDQTRFVPAGAQVTVPIDKNSSFNGPASEAVPYDFAALQTLPVNNLPFRMQIAAAATPEEIAFQAGVYLASTELIATEEPPVSQTVDTTCRRTTKRDTTLWGGPGLFYEAVNELNGGTAVQPILQTTDADGAVWWQLRGSNWIQASQVAETGDCNAIPVTAVVVPPASNALSLETCQTTNGPLRAGQWVKIEFIPPAFDNLGEARDAVSIDPGKISIGSQNYRAQASDPIRLGTVGERYLRRFYIYWEATAGTYRIVGDRLHYLPECTVTVPVG